MHSKNSFHVFGAVPLLTLVYYQIAAESDKNVDAKLTLLASLASVFEFKSFIKVKYGSILINQVFTDKISLHPLKLSGLFGLCILESPTSLLLFIFFTSFADATTETIGFYKSSLFVGLRVV